MRPLVYIDATIPSWYHEIRDDPESATRRQWTRQWWDNRREAYRIVASEVVLGELERGASIRVASACIPSP